MYHYNYKILNTKTGEFYIGVRSCKCKIEDDPYMGSSSIWTKLYIKEHRQDLENRFQKLLLLVNQQMEEK